MKKSNSRLWLIALFAVLLIALAIPVANAVAQGGAAAICPPFCMITFATANMLAPASIEGGQIAALFNFILVLATIVFVLVEGLLFLAVLRHRNRPPEAAMQFHGNTKLEMAWTAAPAVILAVLLGFTFQTMAQVKGVASENVLHVKAIGHQWWWEFRYPELNIITANELVVPVNTIVEVAVESVDVEHGFWVPELFGKVDAVPGYTNRVRFTPTTVRDAYFGGQCTQFCGIQHTQMRLAVAVTSAADFQVWASNQQRPTAPPEALTGDAAAGRELFFTQACVGCHTINGTPAAGLSGPNLTHLASRGFIAGGVLANTPENLHVWIKDSEAVKEGNVMGVTLRSTPLNDEQVSLLVAYLTTLK